MKKGFTENTDIYYVIRSAKRIETVEIFEMALIIAGRMEESNIEIEIVSKATDETLEIVLFDEIKAIMKHFI